MTVKGALIASAVAGMFAAAMPAVANAKSEAKVKCSGINSCKGKSDCSSAKNSCQGQNSCKGQGFKEMTKEECDKAKAAMKSDTSK